MSHTHLPSRPLGQARSVVSLLAIVAALASYYFSFRGQEFVGLLLALLAVPFGLFGGLKALSPRVSGGLLSLAAVVLGVIGVVVALLALLV